MPSRKNNSYGATAASMMPFNSNLEAPRTLNGATAKKINVVVVNNGEDPPNFQGATAPNNKSNGILNNLEAQSNGNNSNANTVMTAFNNGATAPRRNTNANNTFVGGRRRKNRSRKSKKTRKHRR
jgi:hypothetical protein